MHSHSRIVESAPAAQLLWRSEADTAAFATRLATSPLLANAFIELRGDLGAGKTSFARHLLRALGVTGRIKSPTYAVLEPYQTPGGLNIAHFDFYRFNDPREWMDAGLRDVFAAPGLKLADWPEHAAAVLPLADLVLHLGLAGATARAVRIWAPTAAGAQLLREACA
jgi:tRNA threonylcarbamoyladenosine biosynthesis protein TsaE